MKFLDLFAGVGGFRFGMEAAGHESVGFVEIDKYARKSYEAIHNTEGEWTAHDITSVTDDDIRGLRDRGRIDIICGGFPCQAFSVAGKRKGFDDTRGTLFFEVARFANIIRPRYLFLENVKGLLNHDGGVTFEVILRTLDELGYDAEWQVLNSKDFEVPQNRERVFIVGHLRGRSTRKVFPIHQSNQICNGSEQNAKAINKTALCLTAKGNSNWTGNFIKIAGFMDKGFRQTNEVLDPNGISTCLRTFQDGGLEPKIIQRPRGNNNGGSYDIAPTITSNSYEQNNHLMLGYKIRKLTPRECWRLQSYPDWAFDKAATVNSDSQLYKQAGNGVTANVIKAIAQKLF